MGRSTTQATLAVLLALFCGAQAAPTTLVFKFGYLDGTAVGNFTTQLQAAMDAHLAPVPASTIAAVSIANATNLRRVVLIGDYFADASLLLPSLTVLELTGSLSAAANLSTASIPRFGGLVQLNDTRYSGVVGVGGQAVIDATAARGYMAVAVVGGSWTTIRGIRAVANGTNSCIGINMGEHHEVSGCDVGGSVAATVQGRCVWTLATQRAYIHDNVIHSCSAHALDFDAYTSHSLAYNNFCTDNGEEGIFVEETSSYNVVFNNTCLRNGNGIGVYSNAVGPVDGNVFVNNVVEANTGYGITAGGYGHDVNKTSLDNVFIGNSAAGNGRVAFNVAHGAVAGNYWLGNTAPSASPYSVDPRNSSAVAVFEP